MCVVTTTGTGFWLDLYGWRRKRGSKGDFDIGFSCSI